MNKTVKSVLAGVLALSFMFGAAFCLNNLKPMVVNAEEIATTKNVLTISGEARLKVAPDMATMNVGVKTERKTAEEAQQSNAKKMSAVIEALKKLGIDEKDMKTSNYSVYPEYDYEYITTKIDPNAPGLTKDIQMQNYTESIQRTEKKLRGYTANNTLVITVRDLNKVGNVIDTAVKNGSNVADGIRFGLQDQTTIYNKALGDAYKNAQGKANSLAEVIGVKLGLPSKVTEQSYGGGMIERYTSYAKTTDMAMSSYATPIEQGELEVTANVSVEFQY